MVQLFQLQRRCFLQQSGFGLGSIALTQLLGTQSTSAAGSAGNSLAPKSPMFEPRAKNVIFLFMAGAPSQFDLFSPKPTMQKLHGQPVPASFLEGFTDQRECAGLGVAEDVHEARRVRHGLF